MMFAKTYPSMNMIFLSMCIYAYLDVVCSVFNIVFIRNHCQVYQNYYVVELLYLLHLNLSFRSFGGGNYAMQGSEMATMGMEIPGQPMNKKSKAVGETR